MKNKDNFLLFILIAFTIQTLVLVWFNFTLQTRLDALLSLCHGERSASSPQCNDYYDIEDIYFEDIEDGDLSGFFEEEDDGTSTKA